MAKATVAIRVGNKLYDELVDIAEKRDCTITQALDIYIRRERSEKPPKTPRPVKKEPKEPKVVEVVEEEEEEWECVTKGCNVILKGPRVIERGLCREHWKKYLNNEINDDDIDDD